MKGLSTQWIQNVTCILLIRVVALYTIIVRLFGYYQTIAYTPCLNALFVFEAALGLGILIYGIIYEEIAVGILAEGVTACGLERNPSKVWTTLTWVMPMVYELILSILAIYKAMQLRRETAGFGRYSLLRVLIEDQAIYFVLVVFCSVIDIIGDQAAFTNIFLSTLLQFLGSPSLLCLLGSRLLVHLKKAGEREVNGEASYGMRTVSTMGFA
ncbi:hypothetical protein DFH11DRAFT_1643098, partial [Phellopilus nigrolimitatus]